MEIERMCVYVCVRLQILSSKGLILIQWQSVHVRDSLGTSEVKDEVSVVFTFEGAISVRLVLFISFSNPSLNQTKLSAYAPHWNEWKDVLGLADGSRRAEWFFWRCTFGSRPLQSTCCSVFLVRSFTHILIHTYMHTQKETEKRARKYN
jgi:hypothetical protein